MGQGQAMRSHRPQGPELLQHEGTPPSEKPRSQTTMERAVASRQQGLALGKEGGGWSGLHPIVGWSGQKTDKDRGSGGVQDGPDAGAFGGLGFGVEGGGAEALRGRRCEAQGGKATGSGSLGGQVEERQHWGSCWGWRASGCSAPGEPAPPLPAQNTPGSPSSPACAGPSLLHAYPALGHLLGLQLRP